MQAGVRSRAFKINRGVKQGDPISALLFIVIMQDLCGRLQLKWVKLNRKRVGVPFGISMGSSGPQTLTNLRFADDVLLFAQSKQDIAKMLCQFATLASEYGLNINFDQTKIMTRDYCSAGCTSIPVGPMCVSVLSQETSDKTLGGN